ncbi:hypothetical protein KGM_208728 [Danaus plexippus plexippus]|uniref:Uncharacterized protein n=1 Tax=Danaus plexippus plexippus TaxID=278856 RepID=A0A212EZW7_DANPL|nr:hypothetical protein KGM_208728 [Danaus plexippus plexippus]
MTSEIDAIGTNEFLRRRKLRLQQVREQSKDIAKKIRQRASEEQLRHAVDSNSRKEKEYFECQEKLVKRLELLYTKGLKNVGTGHRNALEASSQEAVEKVDLSKNRGREAVAELRKKKQEKLDEQRKILDRKLQAREVANEISREKSASVKTLLTKNTKKSDSEQEKAVNDIERSNQSENIPVKDNDENTETVKNDMGTQWQSEDLPNEWESVPVLSLPKEDSVKDLIDNPNKSKRPNLFALSDEMPSSLRGGLTSVTEEPAPLKPSLTLITDYLQNRNLRLRQPEPSCSKKSTEDLQSIRQTILRTRASRANGSVLDTVCCVLDDQVIPVPSWQAGDNVNLNISKQNHTCPKSSRICSNLPTSPRTIRRQLHLCPQFRNLGLSKKVKGHENCGLAVGKDKTARSNEPDLSIAQKKSISVYNHNTRDIQNVPCNDDELVVRDGRNTDDAYTQAYKETTTAHNTENNELNKKHQDMRNKVAVTRQNVDKEYRDTLAFLNSLPKDVGAGPIRTAYMDDERRLSHNSRHQRKMQDEFKKIEKECHNHSCKHTKRKATECRSKSKSPTSRRDFEYSWMPVPESDRCLAIHNIPNKKTGNTVKFGRDSYHEYRSRHKHTPPTKDTDKRKMIETVIVQNSSTNESSITSESSSAEDMSLGRNKGGTKLEDADKIIIYKILKSKKDKKCKHKKPESKLQSDRDVNDAVGERVEEQLTSHTVSAPANRSVYKAAKNNGQSYQVSSCYTANLEMWQTSTKRRPWWDNVTSLYYTEEPQDAENVNKSLRTNKTEQPCCEKKSKASHPGEDLQKDEEAIEDRSEKTRGCKCDNTISGDSGLVQPSAATSTSSFKTATNDKGNSAPEAGFIKFVDEGGQETGKFYIGASGFIKDDDYEVVIQLRKRDGERIKNRSPANEEHNELDKPSKSTLTEQDKAPLQQKCDAELLITECILDSPKESQDGNETKEAEKHPVDAEDNPPKITPSTCEKAVLTSFQDSYAIPDEVPKTDPVAREATSTYTQTSFNSPIQRPVFMHMSSSTSTAYMSPPDLILPKFLKQDYVFTYDAFDSENTLPAVHQHKSRAQHVKQYHCNKKCVCRRCVCKGAMKYDLKDVNTMKTPPNTARSSYKCLSSREKIHNECKKPKCRKCLSRSSGSKHSICHKSHRRSEQSVTKKTNKNITSSDNVSTPQTLNRINVKVKPKNAKINPVVKKYVNELLSLNKQGLKAIDIINEDCSSVPTPGSSIINDTCNAGRDPRLTSKISLEEIKNMLREKILKDLANRNVIGDTNNLKCTESPTRKSFIIPKKKLHKVKSLNISKRFQNKSKIYSKENLHRRKSESSSSSTRALPEDAEVKKSRSKSSPTPRPSKTSEYNNNTSSDIGDTIDSRITKGSTHSLKNKQSRGRPSVKIAQSSRFPPNNEFVMPLHRAVTTSMSSESGLNSFLFNNIGRTQVPATTCTQTSEIIDSDANFMQLAENKLQNMEKIADLTEKCTKRLSNLARVLEEVRRNKTSIYSQISTSDSASESDNKSGKHKISQMSVCQSDPNILVQNKTNPTPSPSTTPKPEDKPDNEIVHIQFTPFLKDIPRPEVFKSPSNTSLSVCSEKSVMCSQPVGPVEHVTMKCRGRPPPALNRVNLKHAQDALITPHELSTVVEVDVVSRTTSEIRAVKESHLNPDLLQNNISLSKKLSKISSNDSSDDSKMRMMDMKQFNDIMLKPFISLQEYAKQCNIGLDDGSNNEEIFKEDPGNDELSSLHSDGSLPDVIAELLKRKVIAEPFQFDSASNINSTTLSSESTISMLALSKVRKGKDKSMFMRNKEKIAETSETLSISSNPDLEKAFQKLGMGWASSTLKKTKERLALSSSSSASSSSLSQFKIKSFSQNVPTLGTDSTSSLADTSNNNGHRKSPTRPIENSKNAVQQTSLTNSMTVKEFLTNELAKKITFKNKSNRKEADEEFVSLYETKMPEELKNAQIARDEEESSVTSVNNNRARTSTPVQIFKSTTYRSTSSSNTSNGLFSNADDLSSVKGTSNSVRNHSTSDKDDLTIPDCSLKTKKELSGCSKSD